MLTHIWGFMSPDVGRTENQKHEQYKLVLKSSELDPSLLPRLLCFRSPMGVPSEWSASGSGVPHLAAQLHSILSVCSSPWLLGPGVENRRVLPEGCSRWREGVLARAPWAQFASSGFGSAKGVQVLFVSRQAGGGFGVRELENEVVHILLTFFITCRTCSSRKPVPVGACLGSGVLPRKEARLKANYVQPGSWTSQCTEPLDTWENRQIKINQSPVV